MPGTIKVSVLGFMDLPSSSSSSISVTVSMGKQKYQTWDKGDFSFSLTSLRDVLEITVNNVEGNEISRADIQAKSIVEKGLWDDHFPLAGGGRVHLQLQFLLNSDERDRIRTMRQSAMKKKQEEYHSINFQSMEDATVARRNNASFNLNPELSVSHKYLLPVRGLIGKDGRNLSSPALTSIKLESSEKGYKTEEKQIEFDQSRQTPNDADREKDSSSTASVLPEISIHRSESSQEKTDPIINSHFLDDNVSLKENANILKPSGLIALSESPQLQSPDILPEVDCQSSNEQLAQKTVIVPVDEIPVQNISSEENIQPSEPTVAYGIDVRNYVSNKQEPRIPTIEASTSSNGDEDRVHKAGTPMAKTPINIMQMNTAFEGSQAQDMTIQIKTPLTVTYSNTAIEQNYLKEDQSMKPKEKKTKPSSSASDTEALIFGDPKHDEEEIKKRDQEIKIPGSFKRTELGDTLLQKLKATALEEKLEDSMDPPKEVYARDKPPDEKTESQPAEVFIKDQPKEVKEDIKKRDEKHDEEEIKKRDQEIKLPRSFKRTESLGDTLLQKSKATAIEEKLEDSMDRPKEVYKRDRPPDEKTESQPAEVFMKDQPKEVKANIKKRDEKHDEKEIKKRDQEIKLPGSFKRTESLGDTLLQNSKTTALEEKVEDSIDQLKEVYARDRPSDVKTASRHAEVFVKDQPKEVKEDIKKRDEKINMLELLERTKLSGDRLLQKSKATALEEKIEYSIDQPKDVNAMDKPRDQKVKNQPSETHIKDQSKEVYMKNEIEPQEFIETSIMEVEDATVSERVAADQLGKTQVANLVDNPVEREGTRKTPSKNFLEKSKHDISMEEQHFSERSNIWIFPDDATKICVTSGGKTLADLMGGTSESSSFCQGEMRNSREEHRGGSSSGVFKGAETHPENRKSKPLISNGTETSEGRLKQTLNIAFMVGFGTLVLLTRLRKKRNTRVVVRSTNFRVSNDGYQM